MVGSDFNLRKFLIYKLIDPFTNEVRYIGVTSRSLRERLWQHVYEAKKQKGKNTYKKNWILSIINKNSKPIIELIEETDFNNYEKREIYWINQYNNLTNTDKGGNGVILNRSLESISKSSDAKKVPVVGINKSKEVFHFDSIKEASLKMKIPENSINYSLENINYSSYGVNFVKKINYYEGLENKIIIRSKKPKYIITLKDKEYSVVDFCALTSLDRHCVLNQCRKYFNSTIIYHNYQITIIKI